MKTTILVAALLLAPAVAFAVPPPTAPPGSGTAEWQLGHAMAIEAPILYDAWLLKLCGIRSSSWLGTLMRQFSMVNAEFGNKLAQTAGPNFVGYYNAMEEWLFTNQPPPPADHETCVAALDRFDAWQADVAKWRYR